MRCARPAPSRPLPGPDLLSSPAEPTSDTGRVLRRLLVTRPADEADTWVAQLCERGWPAQSLPLIQITAPRATDAAERLHQMRAQWTQFDALMFVSGAAVQHFFAADLPQADALTRTRFWAPGPGTARRLVQALAGVGLAADRIDAPPPDAAQFDSESLWPVVMSQLRAGSRVLIVRGQSVATSDPAAAAPAGGNGREWLIRQCEQAGAEVQTVVAYERHAPDGTHAFHAELRRACSAGSVWLLSSSEALDHLLAVQPGASWSDAQALVTHPRIAQRAQQAGFGRVVQTRPALPDVLRTLESQWMRP
jgi:uroporphyrinogen-III synthase